MVYVWSLFVRILHWLLVVAFAVAFYTHDSEWTRLIHVNAGYMAGILLMIRVVWGFISHGYDGFAAFPFSLAEGVHYAWMTLTGHAKRYIGHNPAGSLVIYGMLIVGLLTVVSGYIVFNDVNIPITSEYLSVVHSTLAWTWLALVVTHVLGVVTESVLHKENLVVSMITGFKGDKLTAARNQMEAEDADA